MTSTSQHNKNLTSIATVLKRSGVINRKSERMRKENSEMNLTSKVKNEEKQIASLNNEWSN
jgi:hypothetical protein